MSDLKKLSTANKLRAERILEGILVSVIPSKN